eukprot:365135-Chlamydomonas_euryale.AAC.5
MSPALRTVCIWHTWGRLHGLPTAGCVAVDTIQCNLRSALWQLTKAQADHDQQANGHGDELVEVPRLLATLGVGHLQNSAVLHIRRNCGMGRLHSFRHLQHDVGRLRAGGVGPGAVEALLHVSHLCCGRARQHAAAAGVRRGAGTSRGEQEEGWQSEAEVGSLWSLCSHQARAAGR